MERLHCVIPQQHVFEWKMLRYVHVVFKYLRPSWVVACILALPTVVTAVIT